MRFSSKYLAILLLFASCRHPVSTATRDVVMVVNLVDDSTKVSQYLAYHQKVWPEVEAGFRKAGYKDIRLYRYNRTLVMIVTVPANADLGEMGRVAESYDPKCREWNRMMDAFQVGVPGTAPGQKWAQADLFYRFTGDTTRIALQNPAETTP
ncbi:L-rhamnose mutarotase [Dinghuibacter silviterrae]|uniref:L-rhamnose mutarotase n=1 Tax=Dinghuibacter silviterrae TaxID=1539049 RepID=A0A4R8DEV3_9BACT|nr:L-rhamnose mutarotase [Dinghuibacter silviterrae]TDW95927.1 L-rhamnose mutarotase [Dinghuibacter silviterrae]